MNDSHFDDLLRTARDHNPLPVSFRQGVWQRIEAPSRAVHPYSSWLYSNLGELFRAWGAASGVAVTVVLGLWLGAATVPDGKNDRADYAASISPFIHDSHR